MRELQQNAVAKRHTMTEANDANEHAGNLTDWQQEYDQISGGRFYGKINEVALSHMQVFREHTSQALRQQCNVWPGSLWLGIPVRKQDCRINGQQLKHNDVMCRPGHCDFELITPSAFDIYGLVVDHKKLKITAAAQGIELNQKSLQEHIRLEVPAATLNAVKFLLDRLLSNDTLDIATGVHQDILITALLGLLRDEVPNTKVAPSYGHRRAVVDQVKQYIDQSKDAPVTMTELCALANVSRRTLQYSFDTILGISPLQFLRLTRLNRVRRQLAQPGSNHSVADIAAYWGFWHLSQFAKDYKQLFGESPSDTLHHRVQVPTDE
ncbi:MAG: helix-turn-helix domain-containing protein [Oleiphilaceae bacterium]|nr:helix-turn-helix domain-containing protein [Oleiphilaceae bacterium]